MRTTIVAVDPASPEPAAIERAAEVIRAGGLVAFPTETVYGLGANALHAEAAARIYEAKGRPAANPIIVHVTDTDSARQIVAVWPEEAERLAERFWPGPLTLVLPRRDSVPDLVTAGGPTVGVRAPAHPVAQALIKAAGVPIAAPSANRSTGISPTRAEHVLKELHDRIELVLDGGPTPGGLESTVLDLSSKPPRILRPGPVSPAEIEAAIGPVALGGESAGRAPLRSPGMMPRHYAPCVPLELALGGGESRVRFLVAEGARVGWLTLGDWAEIPGAVRIVMPTDPGGYGARLYAALHALEEHGVERIVVDLPPDSQDWLAVRDRLRRASAGM